jgi:hypothetical protein
VSEHSAVDGAVLLAIKSFARYGFATGFKKVVV